MGACDRGHNYGSLDGVVQKRQRRNKETGLKTSQKCPSGVFLVKLCYNQRIMKTKKIKTIVKGAAKKTGSFIKKTNTKAGEMAKNLKKEWKKEKPQREELKKTAGKAFGQGMKIGKDVFETIKKDLNEIKKSNNKKTK